MPDQQNVLTNNFHNTRLGREHFYNATDAGRNPENLVEQQGNYATTQPALNGYYAYPGEYQNYQNHNQYQPFFRNNHRSVKLPDIRVNKFDGDPLKWNEWSSMFSSIIHNNRDISDIERMSYLQSLVIGSAKEAVSGYLCNPGFYHEALSELTGTPLWKAAACRISLNQRTRAMATTTSKQSRDFDQLCVISTQAGSNIQHPWILCRLEVNILSSDSTG